MILFGAGGHAKVVISILEQQKVTVSAVLDDNHLVETVLNHRVVFAKEFDLASSEEVIITIGDNTIRRKVSERLASHTFGQAIHPTAAVSSDVLIKPGTVIMPLAIINSSTIVGRHCIINSGAVIEHDCLLEDFVHVAPNATLCGGAQIGEGTLVGAGAVILPGIKVEKWCTIGAGAVVTKNLADGSRVTGNPAREI